MASRGNPGISRSFRWACLVLGVVQLMAFAITIGRGTALGIGTPLLFFGYLILWAIWFGVQLLFHRPRLA